MKIPDLQIASVLALVAVAGAGCRAQARTQSSPGDSMPAGYTAADCPSCASWNLSAQPVRLHGNTYYVGTRGLGAILVTSPSGHVLIDAGLPESAPKIMESVRALGFRVEDIKLILNSHAHYDHAGGIAAIQRASGAEVAASRESAKAIRTGRAEPNDPQYAIALAYPAVRRVREFTDGDTVRAGSVALVARLTPGHTPGGTSWSWRSCESTSVAAGDSACMDFVYADSQTPVSADDFHFSHSAAYPDVVQDFERSFSVLEGLKCDVLITPHPGASRMWERVESKSLRDGDACRRYAANARQQLAKRLESERGSK